MISVIMPVFNVEKYLSIAVESVLNQTFDDFELILVDDGSEDKSGIICDQYSLRDKRIHVIHKKNSGLSSSREVGVKQAIGEYLHFVDSDDWIDKEMLESLIYTMQLDTTIDISCSMIDVSHNFKGNIKGKFLMDDALCFLLQSKISWSLCGKLFKREVFSDIDFDDHIVCGEDLLTNWKLFHKSQYVYCVQKNFYHYRYRENSLTHSIVWSKKLTIIDVFFLINNQLKDKKDKYKSIIGNHLVNEYIYIISKMCWNNFEENKYDIDFYCNKLKHNIKLINLSLIEEREKKIIYNLANCKFDIFKNNISQCINTIKRFSAKYENIYIYGAGEFAKDIARGMNQYKIPFVSFIISDDQNKEKWSFNGKYKVEYLSNIVGSTNNIGVIICIGEKNQKEVVNVLEKKKFTNYILLGKNLNSIIFEGMNK